MNFPMQASITDIQDLNKADNILSELILSLDVNLMWKLYHALPRIPTLELRQYFNQLVPATTNHSI